jgi:lauroyl/myristoyl acyltransferase
LSKRDLISPQLGAVYDALAKFLYRLASCHLTRRVKKRGILRLLAVFRKILRIFLLFIQFAMLLALFRLFSLFPLSVLHALGAGLGWLVYWLSPTYRKRLRENLQGAGYLQHLSQAIAESGKSIAELPFVWCAQQARVTRHCQVENFEMVLQRMAQGQCILFLTPHLGCFELTAQMCATYPFDRNVSATAQIYVTTAD